MGKHWKNSTISSQVHVTVSLVAIAAVLLISITGKYTLFCFGEYFVVIGLNGVTSKAFYKVPEGNEVFVIQGEKITIYSR